MAVHCGLDRFRKINVPVTDGDFHRFTFPLNPLRK